MKKLIEKNELTFEQLFALATTEMHAIVKEFDADDIEGVLNAQIVGDSTVSCIYGTLYGDCNKPEVANFINRNVELLISDKENIDIDEFLERDNRSAFFMTPLEIYIYPLDEEYLSDEEDDGDCEFADSYHQRIKNVKEYIQAIRNEKHKAKILDIESDI